MSEDVLDVLDGLELEEKAMIVGKGIKQTEETMASDAPIAAPDLTFTLTRAEALAVLAVLYGVLKLQPGLACTHELVTAAERLEGIVYPTPNTDRC